MSSLEIALLTVAIFALLAIAAFRVFRQRAKIKIKGPVGTGFDMDASNDHAAIKAEGVKSRSGGFSGVDSTGVGIDLKNVDVDKDVRVKVESKTPKG